MGSTLRTAAGLLLLASLLGCGGGDGFFQRPRGDWQIGFRLQPEPPRGCGTDVVMTSATAS